MKLDESDLESSYFPTTVQRVDKSVGYVVIGILVVIMFAMFVFGLNHMQSAHDQAVGERSPATEPPAADISDTVDTPKN